MDAFGEIDLIYRLGRPSLAPIQRTLIANVELEEQSDQQRWSCFLRQAVKVDSAMKRVIHHEDAETVFG
jgi:hypothetical protein